MKTKISDSADKHRQPVVVSLKLRMFRTFPYSHFNSSLGRGSFTTTDHTQISRESEANTSQATQNLTHSTQNQTSNRSSLKAEKELQSDNDGYTQRFNLSRKVFVGNINKLISLRKLKSFFQRFGKVEYVYMVKDHFTHRFKGIAFVTFCSHESVLKALQAKEEELLLDDRILRIAEAEVSKRVTIVEKGYQEKKDNSYPRSCDMSREGVTNQDRNNREDWDSEITEKIPERQDDLINSTEHTDRIQPYSNEEYSGNVSLNEDVLCVIFTYLPLKDRIRVERVCKQWQSAARRGWCSVSHLHFRNVFKRFEGLTDSALATILHRCGQYLVSLDVSASPRLLTNMSLEVIGETCIKLEALDLSGVSVSDISLKKLSEKCTSLKSISLENCCQIRNKGVSWLLKGCCHLESFNLSGNKIITGDCFSSAGPNLQKLILNGCYKLSDPGVYKMCTACPHLQHLEISSCLGLSDRSLDHISTCTDLEILKMDDLPNMRACRFCNFFSKEKKSLVNLSMSQNNSITDDVLRTLAANCPNLKSLDISSCSQYITDCGMCALASSQKQGKIQLKHLNISYNYKIGDDSIKALAVKGILTHFIARGCSSLTDDSICVLADMCPLLELVDLSGVMSVTNVSLRAFIHRIPKARPENKLVLNLGGTSVDTENCDLGVDPGVMEVCVQDWSQNNLKLDREIILPRDEDEEDDEDQDEENLNKDTDYPSYTELVGMAAGAEIDDDYGWDEFCDEDDFLDCDDPLEMERWEFS